MSQTGLDRREFARLAVVGVATAGARPASAAEPTTAEDANPPEKKPDEKTEPVSPARRITEVLAARYPSEHLTTDVLREIERDVGSDQWRGRRLAAYPLENADEPAFVFSAWRADG